MQPVLCAGRCLVITTWLVATTGVLFAQDPFEIHVLEYENPALGEFTLENHLNYVGRGTNEFEGLVAPTQDQLHVTNELTAGLTDYASLGVMQLNAKRPGSPLDPAGWRLVPHFYVPSHWHWPVGVGLVTEFSFEKAMYEGSVRRVEIIPILEKSFGRVQIDVDPGVGRGIRQPSNARWEFEPAARIGYARFRRFTPSLEYYGALGPVPALLPLAREVHELFSGGDFRLARNVLWNLGIGVGTGPSGGILVYKSRIEFSFGRKRADP